MKLIKRNSTEALVRASRANSQRSTGPRSAAGKEAARANGRKRCNVSQVQKNGFVELGENPHDFIRQHDALVAGMKPRDEWETAWAEDLALLRWRLGRLQRAETAALVLQQRKLATELQRRKMPPTGMDGLKVTLMLKSAGFCGVADSAMKFERVIEYLTTLGHLIAAEDASESALDAFNLVYGDAPPLHAATFRVKLADLLAAHKEGRNQEVEGKRMDLIGWVTREIESYEALQAAYLAEQVCGDELRQDAELIIAGDKLDEFIRYEAHLERQIERRMRQFYARRRERTIPEPLNSIAEPESATSDLRSTRHPEIAEPPAARKNSRPAPPRTLVDAEAGESQVSEKLEKSSADRQTKSQREEQANARAKVSADEQAETRAEKSARTRTKLRGEVRKAETQVEAQANAAVAALSETPAETSAGAPPEAPSVVRPEIVTSNVELHEEAKPSGYSKQTAEPETFLEAKPSGFTNQSTYQNS